MTPGFMPGDELLPRATAEPRYIVQSVLPRIQRIKVLDMQEREERLLDDAEMRHMVASGAIHIRRGGIDLGARQHRRTSAEDKAEQNARAFLREVAELQVRYDVSFNRAYDMLVKDILPTREDSELKVVCRSHAYRLLNADQKGLPLVRGCAERGNRTQRYAPEVYEIIKDLAQQHFLRTQSRWTWRTLGTW
jgi:putative transposase